MVYIQFNREFIHSYVYCQLRGQQAAEMATEGGKFSDPHLSVAGIAKRIACIKIYTRARAHTHAHTHIESTYWK